ncbi:MAG: hypothetical protein IPK31_13510 [Chitinophagaceae bacterium]|nr:hypothetical protein [Chitinophagaceae bacterium]
MIKYCISFLIVSLFSLSFSKAGSEYSETKGERSYEVKKEKNNGKVFILNVCITDLVEFKNLVKAASRLKPYGKVQINIATLADKSFHEIPKGGNPWNEYASNNATLFKFFPDAKVAPFIPAEFVRKNRQLLLDKAKILRENGMEAAFFANEPGFLPAAFFDAYPQLLGPRVDHPRRSIAKAFSPCMSTKEAQGIYVNMMAEMLKAAPEIKTFYFKTNDAGSGNCWADWLYAGPNGPGHCKAESTGERIQQLMSAMKTGAAKSNNDLAIYLSHPQGSSNFSDTEREDIQNHLPENCYFRSTAANEIKSIGGDFASMYPVKGASDILSMIKDVRKIDHQKEQAVFINFNASYARGNESFEVEDLLLSMLADHLKTNEKDSLPVLKKLHEICTGWAGEKNADNLYEAFKNLHEANSFRKTNLGNLSGLNWNVAARLINRPLVAVPQRLTKEEEAYFLPYIFNVSLEEARMDYLDIQGGRWTTLPDSVKRYVQKIKQVCLKLEAVAVSAPKKGFIQKMAIALRVHASMMQSCGNFAEAQQIRDSNAVKLNGTVQRPDKEGTWEGDRDLLKFNAVMRDELDNTDELISILQKGGVNALCLAKDAAHEDCFLLGPNIIGQLKLKRKIMLNHWRDIEDYMTTPFK